MPSFGAMEPKEGRSRACGVAGLLLAIINPGFTSCLCGHMDWVSLPGNVIAVAFAWGAFLIGKDKRVLTRVLIGLACVLATLGMLENGVDILWLGHNPLLR